MLGSVDKNFKYKKVKNFLTSEEIELFSHYSRMRHRFDFGTTIENKICAFENSYYGDYFTESLLLSKRKKMESELNATLLPTYSFFRVYTYDGELVPHKDRPACEISVTIMVDSDGTPWPFYADKEEILMDKGDAVLYRGCDISHSRKKFRGDWHSQIFLHYVDAQGPHAEWAGDKRPMIGEPAILIS